MSIELKEIAKTYFDAWKSRNFEVLREILADNVTFSGPLGKCNNAEECMQGLKGLSSITKDIVIKHMWVDDADVITWYELYTTKTEQALAICNWMHIENGKISSMKVTFDPRPLSGN